MVTYSISGIPTEVLSKTSLLLNLPESSVIQEISCPLSLSHSVTAFHTAPARTPTCLGKGASLMGASGAGDPLSDSLCLPDPSPACAPAGRRSPWSEPDSGLTPDMHKEPEPEPAAPTEQGHCWLCESPHLGPSSSVQSMGEGHKRSGGGFEQANYFYFLINVIEV